MVVTTLPRRLRAVPQVHRFDREQQGAVERPLDERLGADSAGLGDVRLWRRRGRAWPNASSPATMATTSSDATSPRQQRLEPAVGALGAGAPRGQPGVRPASRKSRSVGVRSAPDCCSPVERLGEADAAVQLAVGPAHRVPRVGGGGEVAEDALALDVVVEPALQARPGPGQRFVGELDGVVVAGHQPGGDEQLDEPLVVGVDRQGAPGHTACGPARRRGSG